MLRFALLGLVLVSWLTTGCGTDAQRNPLHPSSTEAGALAHPPETAGLTGPRICFFNEFFDYCYPSGGYCPCPETEVRLEVGANRVVTMNWNADPQPGTHIRAYRWSLDIEDVSDETSRVDEETDLRHWSAWSRTIRSARLGPWSVGEQHRLYVDVGDDLGIRSLGIVRFVVVAQRPPECGTAVAVPGTLWPPNHRFASVAIAGVSDPDGDPVVIRVTRVTQDESPADPLGGPGVALGAGRNTCPDAVIDPSGGVELRAERSATGNGRVYTIWFTASDPGGASCEGSVRVCVPRDQGHRECTDDGQPFDSSGPCGDRGRGPASIAP